MLKRLLFGHCGALLLCLCTLAGCSNTGKNKKAQENRANEGASAPGAVSGAPAGVLSALVASAATDNTAAPSTVAESTRDPSPGGESELPRAAVTLPSEESGPRIYSKRRHVWIYYEPNSEGGWMGFLGLGSSVALGQGEARPGPGCGSFYPIKPRGWVCLNEKTTLDPKDPEYVAIRKFAPKLNEPFPHNYGESRGLVRYTSIPTREQQMRKEYQLSEHLDNVQRLRSGQMAPDDIPKALRGVDVTVAGNGPPEEFAMLPRGIPESRDVLKPLSTVAWSHQFDAEGRTWLVTADLALVAKDRVSPYPRSRFQGVSLEKNVRLPLAFVRYEPRQRYRKTGQDAPEPSGQMWPRMTILPIEDGPAVQLGDKKYYRVKGMDEFVDANDVSVARLVAQTPWGARISEYRAVEGAPEHKPNSVAAPMSERGTWVEVSVLGGWMVAYENTRPVFATLIAPGRGGVPTRGVDPLKTASTPVGTFRVDGKFYTATMANEAFVHSDVPYSQNFHGPHVLHQAYWHDGWGEKRSAGCINLSPIDSLWFFHWTEPQIPDGWFGMRSDKQAGAATIVWVHS